MQFRSLAILGSMITALVAVSAFTSPNKVTQADFRGAYSWQSGDTTEVLLFTDGYFSHTGYTNKSRKFLFTKGGPFVKEGSNIQVQAEYDTRQSGQVGTRYTIPAAIKQGALTTTIGGRQQSWQPVDNGTAPLSGAWQITGRMQDGQIQTIHHTGTRKTVKLLTGNRFQWVAIDPGVKGFYGTGGGKYTFTNGKYTEHIEFFSRDSSRVGASLEFDGKLQDGNWHHSGKSSRGDNIYEVWSRKQKA